MASKFVAFPVKHEITEQNHGCRALLASIVTSLQDPRTVVLGVVSPRFATLIAKHAFSVAAHTRALAKTDIYI